jgi:hypothetical protein
MPDVQMTVAVTRPFPLLFEVPDAPSDDAPWDELPQTTVAATPDERLRDVLRRAADRIGVRLTADAMDAHRRGADESVGSFPSEHAAHHLVYVGFWRPDDDDLIDAGEGAPAMRRRLVRLETTVLIVRDDAGRAVWRRPGLDATVAELLDAHAAGLLEGDPLRPYLIPSTPQGEPAAMVGEWVRFVESLRVLWHVAEALATVGGAWAFVELLKAARKRRQPATLQAIERHAADWGGARGGTRRPLPLPHRQAAKLGRDGRAAGLLARRGAGHPLGPWLRVRRRRRALALPRRPGLHAAGR